MSIIEDTPLLLRYLYKFLGIIQFNTDDECSNCSKLWSHLWCLPLYAYYTYTTYFYTTWCQNSQGIFKYIGKMVGYMSLISMIVSVIVFTKRSDELRSLLVRLNSVQIYSVGNTQCKKFDYSILAKIGMIICIVANVTSSLFLDFNYNILFFCLIPPIVSALDHLFLNDILDMIYHKFNMINQHFQRQINSVDLFVIFPLTKVEKVRVLKEGEVTFNMRKIQELSHSHYNLVNLTMKITDLFEITTIAGMVMWFGHVINTMYYILHISVQKHRDDFLIFYLNNFLFLIFFLFWLLIMVAMYSRVQRKANETATYVHDIWNKYGLKNEVDRRVRHLQLVALRLLNTRLQFTAMDFFNLDWTFCHMMVAALTTYLVILIQFNF